MKDSVTYELMSSYFDSPVQRQLVATLINNEYEKISTKDEILKQTIETSDKKISPHIFNQTLHQVTIVKSKYEKIIQYGERTFADMQTVYEREVQYGNIFSSFRHIVHMAEQYEHQLHIILFTKIPGYLQQTQLQTLQNNYEHLISWLENIQSGLHVYNMKRAKNTAYHSNLLYKK